MTNEYNMWIKKPSINYWAVYNTILNSLHDYERVHAAFESIVRGLIAVVMKVMVIFLMGAVGHQVAVGFGRKFNKQRD
jgi:hypothetical protein